MSSSRRRKGYSATLLTLIVVLWGMPAAAHADYKVWNPDTQAGERAVEVIGDHALRTRSTDDTTDELTAEFEVGLSDFWLSEAEIEAGRSASSGTGLRVSQFTWENLFAFTQRGESWIDLAWFAEWGHGVRAPGQSEFTTGPVLRKEFLGASHALNLFVERASGQPSLALQHAWETRLDAMTWKPARSWTLTPGWQWYGEEGLLNRIGPWARQDQRAGPQLFGKVFQVGHGALEWNAGILIGMTPATPGWTLRWQLEYEMP